jgi:hypothetical protein
MLKKQKAEFSKVLTVVITVYFFGMVTLALLAWLLTDRVLPEGLMWVTAGPFASVTSFYFLKAGYENGKKIQGSYQYDPPTYGQNQYSRYDRGGGAMY